MLIYYRADDRLRTQSVWIVLVVGVFEDIGGSVVSNVSSRCDFLSKISIAEEL